VCLDSGEFYSNFVGCAECSRTDVLHVENRVKQQVDDEETVTYERMSVCVCASYTLCLKTNDTDVACYNFDAHQPVLVIFGRDVAEGVCYQMMICYPTCFEVC